MRSRYGVLKRHFVRHNIVHATGGMRPTIIVTEPMFQAFQ